MTAKTQITAATSIEQLPTNVSTLQQMVLTLLGRIDDLQGQLYYLKRQLFGKKSEKLDPQQRLLFESLYNEVQAKVEEQRHTQSKKATVGKNANHQGRKPLPATLRRETIEIEPPKEDLVCDHCGNDKSRIGEEVTEKLEYEPASFYVKRYVRHKYACKNCQNNVSIGQLPPMVIDKGIPAESVLAHMITCKFADHLPLNRLEGIFRRHGVDITVSNMCDWVADSADLLVPLVKRMHELIRLSPTINTDDTKIPVKNKNRKGSTYNGYLWVYIDDRKNVVFDFTPTRSREGPINFIGKTYNGYVQADAYSGYDELFRVSHATEVGCNSHARRKFEYALDSDPVRAARMMVLWGRLYEIESRAKEENYSDEQLLAARQTEALPIFDEIRAALNEYKDRVLPKSPMGKAITYAFNQWDALVRYTREPMLRIDNNISERMLRMVVIGRKNYLFAGSEAGAQRAAIIYSLVASCKVNSHDPFAYFHDVLKKISTWPANKIDELLPGNWMPPKLNHEDAPVAEGQIVKVA
ncbi:MAG TPA: IS66 family transposase [Deltaproteobacteria bacterium]|nr:IS66 family transposase [Deltaproteobacteria bacterium]